MDKALKIHITGTVQGVGFRPFVYRLAQRYQLRGWVLNGADGVHIQVEGAALDAFVQDLQSPPPAAQVHSLTVSPCAVEGFADFRIRSSQSQTSPTVHISPDLALCANCLAELFDPHDSRYHYPYINCTDCGPRYSIIEGLPYDRPLTSMKDWTLCAECAAEYHDPSDRRFHAQPVACARCGPHYFLQQGEEKILEDAIAIAARLLRQGHILAIKGLGGYHLACDARNPVAVQKLRERKFRKEKPFALMVADVAKARALVHFSPEEEHVLSSVARPIVLLAKKVELEHVAPQQYDYGVMLPYTPLHHLLFAADAPDTLVMTSANRSSEPICYRDDEAMTQLSALADAFLIGERPIVRRVDDSVARATPFGISILRRARGYAPSAVTNLPTQQPILALGADLKNSITLVVDGNAFVSQHLGDLPQYAVQQAFKETIHDLTRMYGVDIAEVTVVHDMHPDYVSSQLALELPAKKHVAVQHHHAHVASVLAERQAWHKKVLAFAFDGTGYGTDGAVWGGEVFVGSIATGFARVAHLLEAKLVGGDAAARYPVQAAVGFLAAHERDMSAAPFHFPERYQQATRLLANNLQVFRTTSMGRLFDTVAALLGFTEGISYEGQAAIQLETLARRARHAPVAPFPFVDNRYDYRPLLEYLLEARRQGVDTASLALAFHQGLARAIAESAVQLCAIHQLDTVVLSGGVFQNRLLLELVHGLCAELGLDMWVNQQVPCNDGGISLGQAALGCFHGSAA